MSDGYLLLFGFTLLAWRLSGARTMAQLAYYLAFTPFVTLDLTDGGLQGAEDLDSGLVLLKMGLRVGTALPIVILLVRRRSAYGLLSERRFLPALFFVAWAVLGLIATREPLVPLMRLGELALFVATGALLWCDSERSLSLRSQLRVHALALVPPIAILACYAATDPALAMHVNQDGLVRMGSRLINAESLGTIGALLVLWSSYELKEPRERLYGWMRERGLPLVVLFLAGATLILARSRTAMLGASAGEFLLFSPLLGSTRRQWIWSTACIFGGLVLTVLYSSTIQAWFLRGESVQSLQTATGRTELWTHLLDESVPEHPLLGNGYLSLSAQGGFWHAGSYWTNAHNAYLAALLYTGIPGFVAVVSMLLLVLRSAWKRMHARAGERAGWPLVFAFGVLASISCTTSFGICGWPNPLMLFFYGLFPIAVLGLRAPESEEQTDEQDNLLDDDSTKSELAPA
ncbi:MAG: O-antigen ligase family protein [Planctomycetes bacterium]|nr:O-antigen ligase family protein [Planctomycetota bacterium]